MESGVFLNCLDQFMLSPLVTWVKTLAPDDGGEHLDFSDLLDGVFLNDIMAQLNPPAAPRVVNKVCRDPSQRIQNLNFLVQQIKTYYLDNLRQLVAIPLPDVLLLGRTPYCEQSLDEMKKLLLLLLGCAVQCDKKEEYIEKIQTLDFDTKAAIAAHIQELTHSQENVLDLQQLESGDMHPEEMEAAVRTVATCLQHLLEQRDAHLEAIAELMQEKEAAGGSLGSPSSPLSAGYSPSMQQQQVGTQQHLVVELADSKAKIRRLRQELEERREQMLDCRHELENMEAQLKRIQQENSRLLVDARSARTYRDELDALRERAMKADKLESEVARYREQLHKMELYKAKVEELKEDNRVLVETKEVLEDQLEGWRARTDKIHQLEKHILLLKARVQDMEQEREVDRKCIKELQEENLALCLAQRRSMEESQHLGWELEQLSKTSESSQGQQTFSEEVTERTRSQLLKLEKENQSLLKTIEELSTKSKESSHQMCSSTDFYASKRACCSVTENSEPLVNGGSNCHQDLSAEAWTPPADTADCCQLESRQLEDGGTGKDLQETMSDLEALENVHNGLHALDGSETPNGSSLHHDGIFTGLPARSSYASKHTQRLEAKVRALDAVNLQLQTSLDSSDRKVALLEEEVQELEAENQTLQTSLEELQISVRRLEQLESEKQSLEQETASLEKNKRHLEKENRRLQQQVEILEANLDNSNVCMSSLEREMRGVVKEVEGLRETAERVKNLEVDNRQLAKQAAIDQKTLATLRQELVNEKMSTQQRDAELRRRTHELEMRVQESAKQPEAHTTDGSVKMLKLETSFKKSPDEDEDDQMLEACLREASSFSQQLCHELKTVKLSCDALQQTQEEWSSSEAESCKAVSKWLQESQEATKELLRVKDHLIKVERNNATLEAEQQAVQVQLKQLEGQSHIQQAQILALQRQAASLQENNTALQTHNANLQVEMSTLNSQSAALMAQNAQLQQQQSRTESERDGVVREREELRGSHEQLLRDHERLVVLHERQAMEYEALMGKHKCLKNTHRTLELEHRTLQDRCNSLLQQRTKLEDLERALKEEQMRIGLEKEQHQSTAAECSRLRDEKDWLNQVYCQLVKDNEALTADHKQLKTQMNEIKLEKTWLEADFSKLKTELQQLDITSMKLSNQCELLSQLKENLDEENRHLLSQIKTLMLQNRSLLEQNMESKDLFHVEERQYIDKLNDLRRQKEKLEEKIMDQYKLYEPSPPRRRGNWITLKLRKLMRSSSRELEPAGLAEPHVCSQESGSFISSDGSGGSASAALLQHSSKDSNASSLPSGCEDNDMVQNHGVQSRAQSESSGEFSLSLENEPWSNGSSPIQQPPSRRSSSSNQPPSDSSTLQWDMKLQDCGQKASPVSHHHSQNTDNQSVQTQPDPVPPQDFWLSRGTKTIRRGSKGKFSRRSSDLGAQTNSGLKRVGSKSETTQSSACSPITVLYVQGKSSSMSGCLNCFSAPLVKERPLKGPGAPSSLPRASNVISTAEGSSRRSSLSSRGTCRTGPQQVSTEEPQTPPGPVPPLKPPRDPAVLLPSGHHKAPVQESLGSPFTFTSVFSNTIFSDAAANTNCLDGLSADHIFLSPNPTPNCPLESQTSSESGSQTLLASERQQSENAAAQKDA